MTRRKKNHRDAVEENSAAARSPAGNAWERYWFGPLASIRPYLLTKSVLILIAFDLWLLRVPNGSIYGLDGFNVAHFRWLDAIQPIPSPELYVGIVLLTGWLATFCALTSARRWALAVLAILYSYTWAMSMLDSFQHHYFLSLVLLALVFFPRFRADELYSEKTGSADPGQATAPLETGKRASSWAYVLLGVTVATAYAFTALTKVSESEFLEGQVLQRLTLTKGLLVPIETWFTGIAGAPELFWRALALGVIAVEVFLAGAYVCAVRQDDSGSRWIRLVTVPALVIAVAFHGIGNEIVLSLRIGWFSYYMIALACVYLLPASVLWNAGKGLTWPARSMGDTVSALASRLEPGFGKLTSGLRLGAILVATLIIGIAASALDLPGGQVAGWAAALCATGASLTYILQQRPSAAVGCALASGIAALAMWTAITQSTVRFQFYQRAGLHNRNRGNMNGAIEAYEKALRYVPEWKRGDRSAKAAE